MRFRTFAAAMAIGLALTAGVEARKKGPHSTPPTVQSMRKGKKFKPAKGRKAKARKPAKNHRASR